MLNILVTGAGGQLGSELRELAAGSANRYIGNEGACSWYDLACETAAAAGHDRCTIRPCRTWEYPVKAPRPAYSLLDKGKYKRTFGVAIPHWREALGRCIQKLRKA